MATETNSIDLSGIDIDLSDLDAGLDASPAIDLSDINIDLSDLDVDLSPEPTPTAAPTAEVQEEGWGDVLTKTLENVPNRLRRGFNATIQDIQDRFGRASGESRYAGAELAESFRQSPDSKGLRDEIARFGVNPDDLLADYSTPQYQQAEAALREGVRSEVVESSPEMLELKQEAEQLTQQIEQTAPVTDKWSAKGITSAILGAGVEMLPAIGATLVTKKPMIGSGAFTSQAYGMYLADGQDKGLSRQDARDRAQLMSAFEGVSEAIPLGLLIKAGTGRLSNVGRGALQEGAQEMFVEAANIGYDTGVLNEEMTLGEAIENIFYSGIVGAGVGAPMGAMSPVERAQQPTPEAPTAEAPEAAPVEGEYSAEAVEADLLDDFAQPEVASEGDNLSDVTQDALDIAAEPAPVVDTDPLTEAVAETVVDEAIDQAVEVPQEVVVPEIDTAAIEADVSPEPSPELTPREVMQKSAERFEQSQTLMNENNAKIKEIYDTDFTEKVRAEFPNATDAQIEMLAQGEQARAVQPYLDKTSEIVDYQGGKIDKAPDPVVEPTQEVAAEAAPEPSPEPAPDFELQQETEAERQQRETEQAQQQEAQQQAEAEAVQKAVADLEVDDFVLEGSERPADVEAARGQQDLLVETRGEAEAKQKQEPVEKQDVKPEKPAVTEPVVEDVKTAKVPQALEQTDSSKYLKNKSYRESLRGMRDLAKEAAPTKEVNTKVDTLAEATQKLGGINRDVAKSEGLDPASFKRNKLFPAKKGMTFDQAAELLNEKGYRNRDNKPLDANDVLDLITDDVNNNQPTYSPDIDPSMIDENATMMREWAKEMGGADKLNNAITKALQGKPLGRKQAAVVDEMLGVINATRTEQVPQALETLEARRKERREAERADFNEIMEDSTGNDNYVADVDAYDTMMQDMPDNYDHADAALENLVADAYNKDAFAADEILNNLENGQVTEAQATQQLESLVKGETDVQVTEDVRAEEQRADTDRVEERQETQPEEPAQPEQVEEYTFDFGKHKGKTLSEVASESPDYIEWIKGKKGFKRTKPELIEAIDALQPEVTERVSDTPRDLERDRAEDVPAVAPTTSDVDRRQRTRDTSREVTKDLEKQRARGNNDSGIPANSPADVGGKADTDVPKPKSERVTTPGVTGNTDPRGRATDGKQRVSVDSPAVKAILDAAEQRSKLTRSDQQANADKLPVKLNDESNIRETLPLLSKEQQDDVIRAEKRLYGEGAKGKMFTNGTGTGKTYTASGIIKRAIQQGKKVLVVAPKGTIAGWKGAAKDLKYTLDTIKDTSTGSGDSQAVITTYQNFSENKALLSDSFDLVVYDESHKLMGNMNGDTTKATVVHRAITNGRSGSRGGLIFEKDFQKLNADIKARAKKEGKSEGEISAMPTYQRRRTALMNKAKKLDSQFLKRETESPTKVVFLSATPFSGHKSVFYADGYLFDSASGANESTNYNVGNPYQQFLVKNFGYRMKYNKANQPGAEVNVGLLEREWADQMFDSGAMTGRTLNLPHDYSRQFAAVEPGVGSTIDSMYEVVNYKDYPELSKELMSWRKNGTDRQLAEALRIRGSLDRIQNHLDLGRKVVVFHQRMDMNITQPLPTKGDEKLQAEITRLKKSHPEFFDIDFSGLGDAPTVIGNTFGDRVGFFNGQVTKTRNKDLKDFNNDTGKKDILVIQKDAGKEGLSAHDISGKYQRALIITNTPQSPSDAIQMEGRIYRFGLQSNAVIEYPTVQTNFEKIAYRDVVSTRTATAENLAMGSQSRLLRESFREGYLDPYQQQPNTSQGEGGQAIDRNTHVVTDFDKALTYYYKRAKKTSQTKAQEGVDYFATPEPVGLSMVKSLQLQPGEKAMEPSAGHGAISRWFPDHTTNVMVEESALLTGELAMVSEGEVRNMDFMDLNVINKFDGIAMNPPFGRGGSDAIKHIGKATKHLNDGGRVTAIYPEGGLADKNFDKWYSDVKDIYLVGEISLPTVMFERAGTKVKTKMMIFDKDTSGKNVSQEFFKRDYSGIENINELFEKLNEMDTIPRPDISITGDQVGLSLEQPTESIYRARLSEFTYSGKAKALGKRELRKITEKYFGEVRSPESAWSEDVYYDFENARERNSFLKGILEEYGKKYPERKPTAKIAESDKPAKGLSTTQVKEGFKKFTEQYKGVEGVTLTVAETQADLPFEVPSDKPYLALYNPTDLQLSLVAENIDSPEQLNKVLQHEMVVHHGLRQLLDPTAYEMQMDRLLRAEKRNQEIKAVFDEVRKDYANWIDTNSKDGDRIVAEEVLAKIAEDVDLNKKIPFIRKMINAIKQMLRRVGILNDSATYQDAVDLVMSNAEGLKNRVQSKGEPRSGEPEMQYQPPQQMAAISRKQTIENANVPEDIKQDMRDVQGEAEAQSLVDTIKEAKENFGYNAAVAKQHVVDEFAVLEYYEKEANAGALQDASESAYKMASQSKAIDSVVSAVMNNGHPVWKDGGVTIKPNTKGFAEIFEPVANLEGNMLKVWEQWAGALRAERLLKEGREKLYTAESIKRIKDFVNADPKVKKAFNQAHKDWRELNNAVLDFSQEAGLISPEQRKIWARDDYVPFYRQAPDAITGPQGAGGLAGVTAGIRRLKGGTGRLNILENMAQNVAYQINNSYKNMAMQRVVNLTEGAAMEKQPMQWKVTSVQTRQAEKALKDIGIEFDDLTSAQRKQYSDMFTMAAPAGKDIVSVMVNGKREYYKVTDDALLRSVTNMGPTQLSVIETIMGFPKRLLTDLTTGTPAFAVRSFVRDTMEVQTGMMKAAGTTKADIAKDFLGGRMWKQGVENYAKAFKKNQTYWDVMGSAGMNGEYYATKPENVRKQVERLKRRSTTLDTPQKMMDAYKSFLAASEMANRMAVYERVLKNGGSQAEAAYQSLDVINFSRRGDGAVPRFLITTVPFLNARIQGLDRLYRGARDNPAAVALKGAILFAGTAALMALNDDREEYWALPEWERDMFWHIWFDDVHYRVPKPFEVGAITATIPERIYEAATRDERVFLKRMNNVFLETFSLNPLPQAISPIIEQLANESFFFGRSIVSPGLQYLPPEEQFTVFTSELAKQTAKSMPDVAPEWLKSPVRLEALIRGYFGSVGGFVLETSQLAYQMQPNVPAGPTKSVDQYPVIGTFIREQERSNKYVGRVYEIAKEANQAHQQVKALIDQEKIKEARAVRTEKGPLLQVRKKLNRTTREFSELNKRQNEVYKNRVMTPDQKRKELDRITKRKNELAKQVAERYWRYL